VRRSGDAAQAPLGRPPEATGKRTAASASGSNVGRG
jgi:hypothetical protein